MISAINDIEVWSLISWSFSFSEGRNLYYPCTEYLVTVEVSANVTEGSNLPYKHWAGAHEELMFKLTVKE